jgi:hypothetical protein
MFKLAKDWYFCWSSTGKIFMDTVLAVLFSITSALCRDVYLATNTLKAELSVT